VLLSLTVLFGVMRCAIAQPSAEVTTTKFLTANASELASARGLLGAARISELWLVSSRKMPANPCCCRPRELRFGYWKHDGVNNWTASTESAFAESSADDVPTTILLPGAPSTIGEAKQIGRMIYNRLLRELPNGQSVRFVVWTWPTEQSYRMKLKDFRRKAPIAEAQGYYLAHFIDGMAPTIRVSLLGYSFGARMATSAAHFLGKGKVQGCTIQDFTHSQRAAVRLILMEGAVDPHWVYPGNRHGKAIAYCESMLNVRNSCDPVMEKYHLLYGLRKGPTAIGYVGIRSRARLGEYADKYTDVNVARWVGSTHDPKYYVKSNEVIASVAPVLLFLN
jgi:hypothetical protein